MEQVTESKKSLPNWCPGCGNFGIHAALQSALKNHSPKDTVIVGGIGCGGNMPYWTGTYGLIGLHGRAIPIATGIKMANPDLNVIVVAGDGDTYGIGLNHLLHGIRRNPDITVIVCNNGVYGLTKGQASPTSPLGFKSPSTPQGNAVNPLNPLSLALAAGANYIAQGYAGSVPQLAELIRQGIDHHGLSLIDVFQPCITYNKERGYAYYAQNQKESVQTDDREVAFANLNKSELSVGIIYKS